MSAGATLQAQALTANEISKLIPDKILPGYSQYKDPQSKVLRIGSLKYALAERNFSSGKKKIKIMLFDYAEAPIMYDQATRKFSSFTPVETDSVFLRSLEADSSKGWESGNKKSQSTQLLLAIHKRYYLIMEGENTSPEELRQILDLLDVERFPKSSQN